MELDEDQEVIPDAETMEFYRIGPPVPSILRKPGERSKRLEISRRVSFSKDVSEGSSESLDRRLRFNAPQPGRTLRKKQSISIIAFCSFAMVTLVGVFWGYIIHGIVHTEGVTPVPTYRNREYLKASAQEEVLRDLDDSDYAVPNLVFLTERSRHRRLRTPVVVLRRHPPPIASQTPSLLTRRWNRTRTFRARRRSANATTTRRRRAKPTRKPVFQWRSKVLVSPPVDVRDRQHRQSAVGRRGRVRFAFPASSRGDLWRQWRRRERPTPPDNDTSLVGNDTEVSHFAGHVVDSNDTRQDNSTGVGASQGSSHESRVDDYEDDRDDLGGAEEEVVSSNALLSEDEERPTEDAVDHVVRNESSHHALVGEGTRNDTFAVNVTTTLKVNVATNTSEAVALGGVVNGTETDYYD
ncbi:hypothetical protein MTO96_002862 [Rhipicephalus appendiculatus]